jgi:hypothetical protein
MTLKIVKTPRATMQQLALCGKLLRQHEGLAGGSGTLSSRPLERDRHTFYKEPAEKFMN